MHLASEMKLIHVFSSACVSDLSDIHVRRTAVAIVDGKIPWDMHKPLEASCTLQLQSFTSADPYLANR